MLHSQKAENVRIIIAGQKWWLEVLTAREGERKRVVYNCLLCPAKARQEGLTTSMLFSEEENEVKGCVEFDLAVTNLCGNVGKCSDPK
jgi:hypothetical protein